MNQALKSLLFGLAAFVVTSFVTGSHSLAVVAGILVFALSLA